MSEKFKSNSFENLVSESQISQLTEQAKKDGIQKMVSGAVVERDGELLLMKRAADDFMGGLVELPSGNVDKGESLTEGLIREVKEETGLNIQEISQFLGTFDYTSGSGKKARQFNFLVKVEEGEVVLDPSEHESYEWKATTENLSGMNISEQTQATIRDAINKITQN